MLTDFPKLTIGIDEAGRGCLAGPVVACALCFDHHDLPAKKLLEQLDDSKKLTKKKREILFKELIKLSQKDKPTVWFGIGVADNHEIDKINIRQATKLAMQRALDELCRKIDLDYVKAILVDGKDNFSFTGLPKPPLFVIDGDEKILEIKAASILAKVFRDSLMKTYSQIYPHLSLSDHNGYGTAKHMTAIQEKSKITAIHRTTFKPIREVLAKKPRMLLHVCCGPDVCIPLVDYKKDYEIIAFWYDPNIQPKSEYDKRLAAFKKVCEIEGVEWMEGEYDVARFFELIKGLEHTPEMGDKCTICYEMRLHRSILKARELNCDVWTSTLNSSPKKCFDKLTTIGLSLSKKYGIKYLPIAFRKNNGFLRAVEYTKKNDIFRQSYCGCIYSDTYPARNPAFDRIRGIKKRRTDEKLPVFVG